VSAESETPVALSPALLTLEKDGLVVRDGDVFRTTRKWQGAMARAALQLYAKGDPGHDLRVPIAHVMIELYTSELPDEQLVDLVEAMLPIELNALGLQRGDAEVSPPVKV
jgi:hypothetical protein